MAVTLSGFGYSCQIEINAPAQTPAAALCAPPPRAPAAAAAASVALSPPPPPRSSLSRLSRPLPAPMLLS
eukprot:3645576-Rhodomonas_salina.1